LAPKRKQKAKKVIEPKCAYCGRGASDFRDPKLFPLRIFIDPLDRDNFIEAHMGCVVDCASHYRNLLEARKMIREFMNTYRYI
jgi:hypothetical protein